MKNKASFLIMQEAILEVVARARHGIENNPEESDPIRVARDWIGDRILELVVDYDVQGYVYYSHLVNNDKVLVVGVQEEAVPDGEQDPDKLFYCEVVRIAVDSLEAWVAKGKSEVGRLLTEEDVEKMKNRSHEWTNSPEKFVEFLNDFIKRTRG